MTRRLARRGFAALLVPALAAATLTGVASAQTVDRTVPSIADPGDLVRVEGTGLGAVDAVDFFAIVGGFVGTWTLQVPPLTATPDFVVVEVPRFGNFAPPGAVPPGDFVGEVRLRSGGALLGAAPIGYLESTFGAVTTVGQGGHEAFGFQAKFELDLATGPPVAGEPFAPAIVDAQPGSSTLLAIGAPATEPFIPVFGGDLTLDPDGPFRLLVGPPANGGEATLNLVVPPSAAGLDVAWQWVTVDPSTLLSGVSDGLRTAFP